MDSFVQNVEQRKLSLRDLCAEPSVALVAYSGVQKEGPALTGLNKGEMGTLGGAKAAGVAMEGPLGLALGTGSFSAVT